MCGCVCACVYVCVYVCVCVRLRAREVQIHLVVNIADCSSPVHYQRQVALFIHACSKPHKDKKVRVCVCVCVRVRACEGQVCVRWGGRGIVCVSAKHASNHGHSH